MLYYAARKSIGMEMALSSQSVYLIGFAESLPTPEVCFSLRSKCDRLICFFRADAPNSFARLKFVHYIPVTPPEKNLSRAINDVQSAIAKFAPDQVAGCDDAALLIFSRLPNLGLRSISPLDDPFAFDKWSQIAAARDSGFATLQTQLVNSEDDVTQFHIRPAILKPRFALDINGDRVSKGQTYILQHNFLTAEVRTAISERPYLIQEFKVGVGEGFFGITRDGEIFAPFGHRRLRMMNPAGSGASACISRLPEAAEIDAAKVLVQREGWTGPFMIEQLRDAMGKSWFIEFNGRFWGSLALTRRCGLDLPRLAFGIAGQNKPRILTNVRPGYARHLGRDLVYILFVLRGPRHGYPPQDWPTKLHSLKAVFSPNRLSSFYNYDASEPLFFLKDAIVTLKNAICRKNS
jgi:hypothetical protein